MCVCVWGGGGCYSNRMCEMMFAFVCRSAKMHSDSMTIGAVVSSNSHRSAGRRYKASAARIVFAARVRVVPML